MELANFIEQQGYEPTEDPQSYDMACIIKQSFIDILNCEKPVPVAHVAKLRDRIQMILGQKIKISPKDNKEGLIAEVHGQYSGLLKLSGLSEDKLNVVAGVGFEPTTFRL